LNELYSKGVYDYLCSDNFKVVYEHVCDKFILNNSDSVLDIGCWNGMFYKSLQGAGYNGSYLGLDLCEDALKDASKKYGKKNTKFLNHDWNGEPLKDKFDAIYCGGVLCFIKDRLGFIEGYIESYSPEIIAIQDLQQTDLSCFDKKFEVETREFYIDINVNEAYKERMGKRQVKIIKL